MKSVSWLLNRRTDRGFTLIETLIASTIFAAVLVVASSAFKFYMSIGSRTINSENAIDEAIASIKVRNIIKGLHYYYIKSQQQSSETVKLMFHGEPHGFSGVSLNGSLFPNQPVYISIAEKRAMGDLKDLVLCEFDNQKVAPKLDISVNCSDPFIIAENVKSVDFSYFGWSSVNELFGVTANTSLNVDAPKVWASEWSTKVRGLLPQYIKINIEYHNNPQGYKPTRLWFKLADADPIQFKENNSNEF